MWTAPAGSALPQAGGRAHLRFLRPDGVHQARREARTEAAVGQGALEFGLSGVHRGAFAVHGEEYEHARLDQELEAVVAIVMVKLEDEDLLEAQVLEAAER